MKITWKKYLWLACLPLASPLFFLSHEPGGSDAPHPIEVVEVQESLEEIIAFEEAIHEAFMNRTRLYETLREDEGVRYEVYLDHLGYPTIGVGHLIKDCDPEFECEVGTKVSEERVEELFQSDVELMIVECNILFGSDWEELPEEVQEILVNMMFNLGRTRLSKFKNFIAAVREHDWARAAVEGRDSLWYRQVTNRAERLMTRLEGLV